MSNVSVSIGARQRARRLALQAVYQWLIAETDSAALIEQFLDDDMMERADADYFRRLVLGVLQAVPDLEALFTGFLDRPLEQLDPIEHAVLLVSCFELEHCPELPYRVAINEAVELTKTYGATDSHRYINGVMDKLARQIRKVEMRAKL